MGGIHAECLSRIPSCRIAGFFNRTRSQAEAMTQKFGGRVYARLGEMLADSAIDAVIIASAQQVHSRQILASLQAGKAIFCEKPLAMTVREMDQIERMGSNRIIMVGHQLRFHPVVEAVRQAIPQLGPVFHADMEMTFRIAGHEGRCWEDYRSGGFFMELGCHLVDLARHFLGEIHHVSGNTLRLHPKRVTEDFAQSLLSFESGATASLITSANYRTTRQGLLRGRILGREGRIDFTIYPYARDFNSAALVVDCGEDLFVPEETITPLAKELPPSLSEVYPGYFDAYQRQMLAFVESVKSGRKPPVSLHDGRMAVEGVLATYHQQGRVTRSPSFSKSRRAYRLNGACHPLLKSIEP